MNPDQEAVTESPVAAPEQQPEAEAIIVSPVAESTITAPSSPDALKALPAGHFSSVQEWHDHVFGGGQ